MILNYGLILLLCMLFAWLIYYHFFRIRKLAGGTEEFKYQMSEIIHALKNYFSRKLNDKPQGFRIPEAEMQKREHLKLELQRAMRTCNHGDKVAKEYVKEYIKEWLLNEYGIHSSNIQKIIPFDATEQLSVQDKFDILLYTYKKEFKENALQQLIFDFGWDRQPCYGESQCIQKELIEKAFRTGYVNLDFSDQLNILVQRIYQLYKGHGVIDEIRDMNIDGVSGGVSGMVQGDSEGLLTELQHFNSVWIFYHGQMFRLEFIGFETEFELERVCKNIYRYGNPGQLSAAKGFMANEMKDGSRVIVVRPPFAESWAFFVRKFGDHSLRMIEELIQEENSDLLIQFLKYIIKGCQVFGITSEQGCGKTTLLKSLIQFIHPGYTLRVQELIFELHLRSLYPDRNIVSFKETPGVSGRDGLDLQKKTDGSVNILGEVATAPVASWLVMVSQVASKFTIFTHHAKTTEHLVMSLRNDLMTAGGFHNEKIAEEQVRMAIRFDVHMLKRFDGHRCIQKVTEILQRPDQNGRTCRDIIVLEKGTYQVQTMVSSDTLTDMFYSLTEEEQKDFTLLMEGSERVA